MLCSPVLLSAAEQAKHKQPESILSKIGTYIKETYQDPRLFSICATAVNAWLGGEILRSGLAFAYDIKKPARRFLTHTRNCNGVLLDSHTPVYPSEALVYAAHDIAKLVGCLYLMTRPKTSVDSHKFNLNDFGSFGAFIVTAPQVTAPSSSSALLCKSFGLPQVVGRAASAAFCLTQIPGTLRFLHLDYQYDETKIAGLHVAGVAFWCVLINSSSDIFNKISGNRTRN